MNKPYSTKLVSQGTVIATGQVQTAVLYLLRGRMGLDNGRELNIEGLLERLSNSIDGDRMTIGEMVEAVEERGFGPILLVPALLAVLPTGAVPGVPTICAALVLLVAIQMALGKNHPWVPRRLRTVAISRTSFESARSRSQRFTRFIDRFIHPRLMVLSCRTAARVIPLLAISIALMMPPLELVPFAAFLPGIALVFLGLGLSARDGVLILAGALIGCGGILLASKTLLGLAS